MSKPTNEKHGQGGEPDLPPLETVQLLTPILRDVAAVAVEQPELAKRLQNNIDRLYQRLCAALRDYEELTRREVKHETR